MNRAALPRHWSPQQAFAVYEFLQHLSEQLWDQYHADFIDRLDEPAVALGQPIRPEAAVEEDQLGFPFDDGHDPNDGHDLPF